MITLKIFFYGHNLMNYPLTLNKNIQYLCQIIHFYVFILNYFFFLVWNVNLLYLFILQLFGWGQILSNYLLELYDPVAVPDVSTIENLTDNEFSDCKKSVSRKNNIYVKITKDSCKTQLCKMEWRWTRCNNTFPREVYCIG